MNRNRITWALALGAAIGGIALGTTGAFAFTTYDAAQPLEKPLPEFDVWSFHSDATAQAQTTVEQAMNQKFDGEWHVYTWNAQTNSPSNFYGSGVQVADDVLSTESIPGLARGLINQNRAVFNANPSDLRIWAQREGAGKKSVIFQQSYHGVDVMGGRVHLIFTDEGRFFTGGSDFYSNISVD